MNYVCLRLIKNTTDDQHCGWINIGSLDSQRRNIYIKEKREPEF